MMGTLNTCQGECGCDQTSGVSDPLHGKVGTRHVSAFATESGECGWVTGINVDATITINLLLLSSQYHASNSKMCSVIGLRGVGFPTSQIL